MRAVLFFIIIAVLIIIAAMATGFVSISKMRGEAPQVSASGNGLSVKGGEPPAFDVETGSVKVGTMQTSMNMPTLEIQKAGKKPATETGNKM